MCEEEKEEKVIEGKRGRRDVEGRSERKEGVERGRRREEEGMKKTGRENH